MLQNQPKRNIQNLWGLVKNNVPKVCLYVYVAYDLIWCKCLFSVKTLSVHWLIHHWLTLKDQYFLHLKLLKNTFAMGAASQLTDVDDAPAPK